MASNPPKISHLILISGPSAAGKSTLIETLTPKDGAGSSKAGLPTLSEDHVFLDGNDVLKRDQPIANFLAELPPDATVLAHYDIVHIARVGASEDYADDPFFEVFENAGRVTVLDLRPDVDLLRRNFLARQAEQMRRKGLARRLWRRWVHDPLRALRHKREGIKHLNKADLYQDREWLEARYVAWDDFLRPFEARDDFTLVRLQPKEAADGSQYLSRL